MRFRSGYLLFALLHAASGTSVFAGWTLDGGVTINGNGGTVGSGADATIFQDGTMGLGHVDMDHNILLADSSDVVGTRSKGAFGSVTDYFTVTRVPNTCYIGENQTTGRFPPPFFYSSLLGSWLSPNIYCSPPACDTSPIVLDLARNGFHLTSAEQPVAFDIDADGTLDSISWTAENSDDSFLCLDRNKDGLISSGEELFGNATPLASGGRATNGFQALSELDLPEFGGNGDGAVSRQDSGFRELCVWRDANRDGMSQAQEIRSLSTTSVVSIELGFQWVDVPDGLGNVYWLESTVWMGRGPSNAVPWPTYDVMFDRAAGGSSSLCDPW